MMRRIRQVLADARDDRGFTLAELMVATMLFLLVSGIMFTAVLTGARVMRTNRTYHDLNEEARVVLNRVSREIREARAITAVTNPGSAANQDRTITFEVDFDGDDLIEEAAADPERLTYTYDHAANKVQLTAGPATYDVLAANVTSFALDFTSSSAYLYDANGDGVTTWQELDADATFKVGNGNGVLDDELAYVDSVTIDFTVLDEPHQQHYRTTIDLRNIKSIL